MDYLPIFLDLRGKTVVVDGGTTIASRRAERALGAGAIVHVFDDALGDEFEPIYGHKNLHHKKRRCAEDDILGAAVVYGCSEDPDRDRRLADAARKHKILMNVADEMEHCDFITPSIVDRSPLVIAISTGGTAPIIARILRARIESLIPPAFGQMAEFFGKFRDVVLARIKVPRARRRFWEETIDGASGDLFLAGNETAAEKHLLKSLTEMNDGEKAARVGEVFLVGAGPGDPDLLTFRALRLMQRADVVLYDRLIGDGILELVRQDAKRIYVGKLPKQHTMQQEDISDLLVDLAKSGKRVLRLKGGDPFLFGRGGEEIERLAENKIPFQVVPGITAASGCSAYAGIPLTHRDHAQSCVFVTAHGKDGVRNLNWESLVRPDQTVAIYMGLSSLGVLVDEMVERGLGANLPVAVIDKGTRAGQKIVTGSLADIVGKVATANLEGPSMIILGQVVKLRDRLNWFGDEAGGYAMSITAKRAL